MKVTLAVIPSGPFGVGRICGFSPIAKRGGHSRGDSVKWVPLGWDRSGVPIASLNDNKFWPGVAGVQSVSLSIANCNEKTQPSLKKAASNAYLIQFMVTLPLVSMLEKRPFLSAYMSPSLPLINEINSSLVSRLFSCLVNCSIASTGCMVAATCVDQGGTYDCQGTAFFKCASRGE